MDVPDEQVRVVVATAGTDAHGMSFDAELQHVKSSLLYADTVTLTTPKLRVVAEVARTQPPGAAAREAFARSGFGDRPGWQAALAAYQVPRGQELTEQQRRFMDEHAEGLRLVEDLRRQQVADALKNAGAPELQVAVQAGVLNIDPVRVTFDPAQDARELAEHLDDVLNEAFSDDKRAFPLFDVDAQHAMRAIKGAWRARPTSATARATEADLATTLIRTQLDVFPHVPMDVLLDVREALRAELQRFRAEMVQTSAQMDSHPFDDAYVPDSDQLWRERVQPALQELNERMRGDADLYTSLRRGVAGAGGTALSVLTAGPWLDAEDFAGVLSAAGVQVGAEVGVLAASAAAAAAAAKAEVKDFSDRRELRRSHPYFLLPHANAELRRFAAQTDRVI